jgi:hypothetical protein
MKLFNIFRKKKKKTDSIRDFFNYDHSKRQRTVQELTDIMLKKTDIFEKPEFPPDRTEIH